MDLKVDSWRLELSLGHHETDEEDEEQSYFVPDFRQQSMITYSSLDGALKGVVLKTTKPEDRASVESEMKLKNLRERLCGIVVEMLSQVISDAHGVSEHGFSYMFVAREPEE